MASRSRRALLLTGAAVVLAGCGGPELTYENEGAQAGSDEEDELGASELERIVTFARDSNAMLSTAVEVFEDWEADPESVPEETFDELRRDSTRLTDEYWRRVVPYEEELATFARDTSVEGYEWDGDGQALVQVLEWHEYLLDAITTAAIDIIEANRNPARVPTRGRSAVEQVIEESDSVIASTEEALGASA